MKLSELGEFELIDRLSGLISETGDDGSRAKRNLIIGMGDDAAAWQADTSIRLATTDSLVQDIHFRLDLTSWNDLGWRAMAANLSDIAAMGGLPEYALVSLSLPGSTDVDNILDLYRGMLDLTRDYGTVIIGGDMTEAPIVVINITVLGVTPDNCGKIMTRSAAVPGDKIAVTGFLGASAAGLEILKNTTASDTVSLRLTQAFLKPVPEVQAGQLLCINGVKAAIDISDGLLADLGHICESSNVGARLYSHLIPLPPDAVAVFGNRALEMAMTGGEDYELLFTAPEDIITRITEMAPCPITVIGEITEETPDEVHVYDEQGNIIPATTTGWKHFLQQSE